jgi:hypothetical protein
MSPSFADILFRAEGLPPLELGDDDAGLILCGSQVLGIEACKDWGMESAGGWME